MIMGFASNLVPLIKKGTKTLTYRLDDRFQTLRVGDIVFLKNSSTGKVFAEAKITQKSQAKFKDLPINQKGHEVYRSKNQQKEIFQKYYGKEISDDEKVLVFKFKVKI